MYELIAEINGMDGHGGEPADIPGEANFDPKDLLLHIVAKSHNDREVLIENGKPMIAGMGRTVETIRNTGLR